MAFISAMSRTWQTDCVMTRSSSQPPLASLKKLPAFCTPANAHNSNGVASLSRAASSKKSLQTSSVDEKPRAMAVPNSRGALLQTEGNGLEPAVSELLSSEGRKVDSFPEDFATAILAGKVSVEVLRRFLELESSVLLKMVWGIQGVRERLLADRSFPAKVGIECGIGMVTKVTAESAKRGAYFAAEIDFVLANMAMAVIADFLLTWLPAPTLSFRESLGTDNRLTSFFAGCPENAFQKVQPGMPAFTVLQRLGSIVQNGAKLMVVGVSASMVGVGLTNFLCFLRETIDPAWAPPNAPQDVLATSIVYGLYVAVSSNLRYQIIAGIVEERGIETYFKGRPQLCTALSFVVRTSNTFLGSLLWVDFVRLCGMQISH